MLEDGVIKTANLTSMTVNIYDTSHTSQFTITTTSFTNGVAILTKNTPDLDNNTQYYVAGSLVTVTGTITGTATFVVLE